MEYEKHNEYLNVLKMLDFTYERSRKYYFLISLIEKVLNEDNKIYIGFTMTKDFGLKYNTDKKYDNIYHKSEFMINIKNLNCLINNMLIHSYSFINYIENDMNNIEYLKLSSNSLNELINLNKIVSSPQYFNNLIFKNDCQKLTIEIINYEYEKYKNIDKIKYHFFNEKENKEQNKIYRELVSFNNIKIFNKDFFNFFKFGIKQNKLSFTNNFNKYENQTLICSSIILQSYYIFDDLYDEILNNSKDEKRKEYIKNLIDKTIDLNKHEILQHLTFDELFNSLYY